MSDYEEYDYDYSCQNQNETILTKEELYSQFKQNLSQIADLTMQPEDIAFSIFAFYNFSERQIQEEYLINQSPQLISALQLQGVLQTSKIHTKENVYCVICQYVGSAMCLDCEHFFCLNCWQQMLEVQFSNFIPIVKCLQDACQHRLPLKYLEQNNQFKQIVIKRFMQNDPSITWCPGINCENVFKCETSNHSIKCPCGIKFCSICKKEKHYPIPCDIYKKIDNLEDSNDFWVNLNASKCPHCFMLIQRTQGCFHLKCPCGQHFCYACSRPWAKDHEANFYDCPYKNSRQNVSKYAQQIQFQQKQINNTIIDYKLLMESKAYNSIHFKLEKYFQKLSVLTKILKQTRQLINYNYYLLDQSKDLIFQQNFEIFRANLQKLIYEIGKDVEIIQFQYTGIDEQQSKLQLSLGNQKEQIQKVDENESTQEKQVDIADFNEEELLLFSQIKVQKKALKQYIKISLTA